MCIKKKERFIFCLFLAFFLVLIVFLFTINEKNKQQIKHLQNANKEQKIIIDSLLARKSIVLDVKLQVQDKTRTTINGKGNSGTINVPSEKVYVLQIDSTSISVR